MQNIIVTGMLRDFAQRHSLDADGEDVQFEKFVNYSLWKTDHYDTFDFNRVSAGSCVGIDGRPFPSAEYSSMTLKRPDY